LWGLKHLAEDVTEIDTRPVCAVALPTCVSTPLPIVADSRESAPVPIVPTYNVVPSGETAMLLGCPAIVLSSVSFVVPDNNADSTENGVSTAT
jgi:hypothetical protein